MNNRKTVLLTGASGFIGSYLAYELLKRGYILKLLVRNKRAGAGERLKKHMDYLFRDGEDCRKLMDNAEVIPGDITLDDLGIRPDVARRLQSEIDMVIHSAAVTNFREDNNGELQQCNVRGTERVLDFALKLKQPEFSYISTAYVCGKSKGRFTEDDLDLGQGFNNAYEESKFKAEKSVNAYRDRYKIKADIYRPSIVVGDSQNGKAMNFSGIYSLIKAVCLLVEMFTADLKKNGRRAAGAGVAYGNGKLHIPLRIPADPGRTLNVVPVDYVVHCIIQGLERSGRPGKTYHLVSDKTKSLEQYISMICSIFRISGIELAGDEDLRNQPMTEWEKFFIASMRESGCYLKAGEPRFIDSNTKIMLDGTDVRCPEITEQLLHKLVSYYTDSRGIKI